jgi:hypothetical protein
MCFRIIVWLLILCSCLEDGSSSSRGLGRKNSVSLKNLLSSTANLSTGSNSKDRPEKGHTTASGVEVVISDPILDDTGMLLLISFMFFFFFFPFVF